MDKEYPGDRNNVLVTHAADTDVRAERGSIIQPGHGQSSALSSDQGGSPYTFR